jgi:1-acyl-sn-glycerol-3-phosphate acyltransferase
MAASVEPHLRGGQHGLARPTSMAQVRRVEKSMPHADVVLAVLRELYTEVHRHEPPIEITLDSRLDRDLGFDSIARVELLLRIESALALHLPDAALESAETPNDLLRMLAEARPTGAAPALGRVELVTHVAEVTSPPASLATLTESLDWHVHAHPDRVQIRCLTEGDGEMQERTLSYSGLQRHAEAIAAGLQALGLARGQTVAIMLPTGPDYFHVFFGVLMAGGAPVPIYPPFRMTQIEEHVRRHAAILANAQAAILVTVPEARPVARLLQASVTDMRHVVTADDLRTHGGRFVPVALDPSDIAFIQYTSGSTGNPKGVVLTHANLLANIHAIGEWVRFAPDDVIVSWLPLYHDMGLIAAWLSGMYFGAPLVVMPPQAFLLRPERWLWAIHRYRGTLSAAPNFAFELCLKRIDDKRIRGLDLGSLRAVVNGSEQVQPGTIERFMQRFTAFGLHPGAIVPVYGLAENTVGLAACPIGRLPRIDRIRRESFLRTGHAQPAGDDDANPLRFVSCGQPLIGHEIRVVDDQGGEVAERVEGRLEFRGPSATRGYYRNEEKTLALFHGDWLDSGDRAYLADGEVFVTGRVKDVIIRSGRNVYPDEIEQAVGAIPGIRKGCVVAFGLPDPRTGTERLVVIAETHATDSAARTQLRDAVMRATVDLVGEAPDEVVLAPPKAVLKTSSGKLRRSATRERYEAGLVGRPLRAAGWQLARLVSSAMMPFLSRMLRAAREMVFAAYAWAVFGVIAPLGWIATVLMPSPKWAWSASRMCARVLLALAGIPVSVAGLEYLRSNRRQVVVMNHASYFDGLILLAVLPRPLRFVAKSEFLSQPVSRLYLERLGAVFVERFEIQRSVEDTSRVVEIARAGQSLAFFPEGTFVAAPGVLPFHLGAFVAAAKTGAEVVPVAIRGTRAIMRSGSWCPRRGQVTVIVGEPISPSADQPDTFTAALSLRDTARAFITAHCGEPDAGLRAH